MWTAIICFKQCSSSGRLSRFRLHPQGVFPTHQPAGVAGNQTERRCMHWRYQWFKPVEIQGFSRWFCSRRLLVHKSCFHFASVSLAFLLMSRPWKLMLLTPILNAVRRRARACIHWINTTCVLQLHMAEIRRGFRINLRRQTRLGVLLHTRTLRRINCSRTSRLRLPQCCKDTALGCYSWKTVTVAALVEQGEATLTVVFQKDRCCHLKSSLFSTTLEQLQGCQGSPGAESDTKL